MDSRKKKKHHWLTFIKSTEYRLLFFSMLDQFCSIDFIQRDWNHSLLGIDTIKVNQNTRRKDKCEMGKWGREVGKGKSFTLKQREERKDNVCQTVYHLIWGKSVCCFVYMRESHLSANLSSQYENFMSRVWRLRKVLLSRGTSMFEGWGMGSQMSTR